MGVSPSSPKDWLSNPSHTHTGRSLRDKLAKWASPSELDSLVQSLSTPEGLMQRIPLQRWINTPPSLAFESGISKTAPNCVQVKFLISGNFSLLSKVACVLFDPKYGFTHTGIQIGDVVIDWVDNSICQIRPATSSSAIVALDLGPIAMKEESFKNVRITSLRSHPSLLFTLTLRFLTIVLCDSCAT